MSAIFDDENYFSENFTSFHYSEMCLFPQLELPLQETDSQDAPLSPFNPFSSEPSLASSTDEVTSESDATRPVSPSDSFSSPPASPQPTAGPLTSSGLLFMALDSIFSVKSWTRLSYQKREKLAQSLSAVFESQDLGDANKVELIRVILPDTTPFLDATDTLDIDLSRLTDERLQAIQELLQQVFYNLGERLPPSPGPHKTRGRPRGRHRVNHLKQKEKVKANMGVLRRQNQKFFSREQVVSLTGVHEEEDELVDVLG